MIPHHFLIHGRFVDSRKQKGQHGIKFRNVETLVESGGG